MTETPDRKPKPQGGPRALALADDATAQNLIAAWPYVAPPDGWWRKKESRREVLMKWSRISKVHWWVIQRFYMGSLFATGACAKDGTVDGWADMAVLQAVADRSPPAMKKMLLERLERAKASGEGTQ